MKICKRGHEREDGKKQCKVCSAITQKAWYEKNKERHQESVKRWRSKNKDVDYAIKKRHYENNKEKIKARSKEWSANNKDRVKETKKEYQSKNAEKIKKDKKEYYENNKEETKEFQRGWRRRNRDRVNFLKSQRRATELQRTPKWLSKDHFEEIREFYKVAQKMEIEKGEEYQVDHIIPLRGKYMSGLHVPWNLRVVTRAFNNSRPRNILPFKGDMPSN